jgi:hypothetical protein
MNVTMMLTVVQMRIRDYCIETMDPSICGVQATILLTK